MKHIVSSKGVAEGFSISSAAVTCDEIGNDIYPPAKRKLQEYGIPFSHHRAHKITVEEFSKADYVVLMDRSNVRLLRQIPGIDAGSGKVRMMMDFTPTPGRDVADPWYTGDFEATYRDLILGCNALFQKCMETVSGSEK